jgi:hypothetical protein
MQDNQEHLARPDQPEHQALRAALAGQVGLGPLDRRDSAGHRGPRERLALLVNLDRSDQLEILDPPELLE